MVKGLGIGVRNESKLEFLKIKIFNKKIKPLSDSRYILNIISESDFLKIYWQKMSNAVIKKSFIFCSHKSNALMTDA